MASGRRFDTLVSFGVGLDHLPALGALAGDIAGEVVAAPYAAVVTPEGVEKKQGLPRQAAPLGSGSVHGVLGTQRLRGSRRNAPKASKLRVAGSGIVGVSFKVKTVKGAAACVTTSM